VWRVSTARSAIHPGARLAEQLAALDMSAAELGRQLQVPAKRIAETLNGQRGSPATSRRAWGTSSAPERSSG
jgi:plasmid maintenance system antidote protein VapI